MPLVQRVAECKAAGERHKVSRFPEWLAATYPAASWLAGARFGTALRLAVWDVIL